MDFSLSLKDCFEQFLTAKKAKCVVDKTIDSYQNTFKAISKHLLTMKESMRNSNLSDRLFTIHYILLEMFNRFRT